MRLDRKDIEAIAKSRTSRAEGNRSMYYAIGALLSVMLGGYLDTLPTLVRFLIALVGVAVFYWYILKLNKRTNIAKKLLLKEWEGEQGGKK